MIDVAASPHDGRGAQALSVSPDRILLFLATGFALFAVPAIVWSLWNEVLIDYACGVWLPLASDLSSVTLYRPLISSDGFGGTRYFPLNFLLIAGFVRMGVGAVAAGHVVMVLAGAALALGVYRLLRECQCGHQLALATG